MHGKGFDWIYLSSVKSANSGVALALPRFVNSTSMGKGSAWFSTLLTPVPQLVTCAQAMWMYKIVVPGHVVKHIITASSVSFAEIPCL